MLKTLWLLVRRTAQEYSADNCSHMAAAISYYVLFSIVPLAIFLVSIFGLVVRSESLQEDVATEVVDFLNVEEGVPILELDEEAIGERLGANAVAQIQDTLVRVSPATKREIADTLEAGGRVTIAGHILQPDEVSARPDNAVLDTIRGVSNVSGALTIVGLAGMAWSASAMFGAIRKSLNIAWDTDVHRPIVQQKLLDVAMVVGLGVLLGLSVAGTAALRTLRGLSDENLGPLSEGTGFVWSVLPLFLPAVFSFAVFLLLYRYVPNVTHGFRDVWPGALLATVLFELLKNLFALYVANFNSFAGAYGALGGILLFLLWTYLTANILLVGAELAAEHTRVARGEVAEPAPVAPKRPLRETVRRAVRGLFLHHPREEPARPERPREPPPRRERPRDHPAKGEPPA